MPLQSTLRTGMSLWQTWRRATWVSLVRRTCWSSSYLTGSSCRAFWVSHSIWRSCFSWTTPANDLAWGVYWALAISAQYGSLTAMNSLCSGLTSGPAKAFQYSILVWCFSCSSSLLPSFLPLMSDLQHSLKALPVYSCPCSPLSFSDITSNKCLHF